MKKIEKTVVYVVDFVNKQVLLSEVINHKNKQKSEESLARIQAEVSNLTSSKNEKVAKESKKAS